MYSTVCWKNYALQQFQWHVHPSDFDLMSWATSLHPVVIEYLLTQPKWLLKLLRIHSSVFVFLSSFSLPTIVSTRIYESHSGIQAQFEAQVTPNLVHYYVVQSSNHVGLLSMHGGRYMWSLNLEIIFQSISIQLIYLIANRSPNCNTSLTYKLRVTSMYSTSLEFIMEDHHLLFKRLSIFIFIFQLEMKDYACCNWFKHKTHIRYCAIHSIYCFLQDFK